MSMIVRSDPKEQRKEDDTGWSPYLSIEDAYKLDDVRQALRQRDFRSAAKYGRIYEMRPVVHQ